MKIVKSIISSQKSISDYLVAENVDECYGRIIVDILNEKLGIPQSSDFFSLEEDNYKVT